MSFPSRPARPRVLLASGDAVERALVGRMLSMLEVEHDPATGTVSDLDGVLVALAAARPDVLLVDLGLLEAAGAEQLARLEGTPTVGLGSVTVPGPGAQDEPARRSAGIRAVVARPVALDDLRAALVRPPARPALDEQRLAGLVDQLGCARTVAEIAGTYLASLPERLARLEEALVARDEGALRGVGHSLKSSSALLGLDDLADLARRVEQRPPVPRDAEGRGQWWQAAQRDVGAVAQACEQARAALSDWVSRPVAGSGASG